jgi:hypothetical protein
MRQEILATDYTRIVAGAEGPRSSGGALKYVGTSSKWVPNSGAVGNLETTEKRGSKKRGTQESPPEKRTKMNLTSFHSVRKSQIVQPKLFFEQRARPPEVACPCSKNKGHTRIKS